MLTISQLADYVGVTVRAVRHYHHCGLLPEPQRDASGYRRYDADAVIDLVRIKALADAGVPLARIRELLAADSGQFADAVTEIDRALARRIRELQAQRRRIAQLTAGDRLFVPEEIADLFEAIRSLGISEEAMRMERDGWILLAARYPEQATQWARDKLAAFADPEFQEVYRSYNEAFGWQPDDPRLEETADALVDFMLRHREELERSQVDPEQPSAIAPVDDPAVMALLTSATGAMPPAWVRLDELCREKSRARGTAVAPASWP